MVVCTILGGCTSYYEENTETNNDSYNNDFSVADIEGRWYWKDFEKENAGIIDYLIFDISDDQAKVWTISGHYENVGYRYPVYESTTYYDPIVYNIVFEDCLCYLQNANGNNDYEISKPQIANTLIVDAENENYTFALDNDNSIESTLDYIYN